jgi:hypothetical protein
MADEELIQDLQTQIERGQVVAVRPAEPEESSARACIAHKSLRICERMQDLSPQIVQKIDPGADGISLFFKLRSNDVEPR